MRDYEMMVIINPDLGDEEVSQVLEKFKEIITQGGGELEKIEEWGKRKLAYEIKHKKEGYYAVFYFKGQPDLPDRLRREIRLNPDVYRGMIIRRGD